ncbi:eukaryotic translation initiation factor 4e, putative [Perkinsus marinus ATCC 50983]|uniref:Eukaryotic translation initiation factor 4e, putative n=1 Tax=Perkinsus marinus (strain ATCC 50983 / TXsc) TaxID=423536 RepID=C5L2V8_PERM5|nr:eukaryotic translation initiation factor 4e, putative [Perkinsus marinus ATCC 50983]EER08931.1 eukaryotic translation initiation factor 4e, putative [Perkinsus marinus ATCC 50983]|eukprot:XP_002777115.1 eukaryotic translation initiation factor 4e, putative [Perkinsus marinus ATCC 50983]
MAAAVVTTSIRSPSTTTDDAEEEQQDGKNSSSNNSRAQEAGADPDIIDGQFILPDSVIVEFEADDEATEPQIKEAAARRERSRSSSRPRRRSGISASPPLCPQSRYLLWSCVRSDSEAEPSPVLQYSRKDPDSSSSTVGAYNMPPPWLGSTSGNAAAREAVELLKAKQKSRSKHAVDKANGIPAQEVGDTANENHHAPVSVLKNRRRRRGRQVQQGAGGIEEQAACDNATNGENKINTDNEPTPRQETPVVAEGDTDKATEVVEEEVAKVEVVEEKAKEGTPLFDTFTIWYDPGVSGGGASCKPAGPRDSEEYTRGLIRLGDVDTVEGFWQFWNSIDLMKLPKFSTISVFKNGIQPAWEDEHNQEGGRWVVKGLCRSDSKEYYSTCVLALLGNLFTAPQKMNGIVLSVRPRGNSIALWNTMVDPELFEVIDWELRSIAPEDMQETVEVEYRDHRGAINHNMRKLGSGASHWRLCTGMENAVGSMMMTPSSNEDITCPDTLYDPYTTPKAAAYYPHAEFNADAPEFCPGSAGCGQLTGLSTDTGSSNSFYMETPVWDHSAMYWEGEYNEEGVPLHGEEGYYYVDDQWMMGDDEAEEDQEGDEHVDDEGIPSKMPTALGHERNDAIEV